MDSRDSCVTQTTDLEHLTRPGRSPGSPVGSMFAIFIAIVIFFLIKISPFLCVSRTFHKLLVMMANMHEYISQSYLAKLKRLLKPPLFFVV